MIIQWNLSERQYKFGILAIVLVLAFWAIGQNAVDTTPNVAHAERNDGSSDVALYRAIANSVERGEGYYPAVAKLHRDRDYPLRPFYAARPPTLAWIASQTSDRTLIISSWLLLIVALLVWMLRLRDFSRSEKAGGLLLLAITGAPMISSSSIYMHELWCGLLLTIALGIEGSRHRLWQILLVSLALAIREFAAAFLALVLLRTYFSEDRRGIFVILAVIIGAIALFMLHRNMVQAVTTDSDAISQGWLGMGGPIAFARALSSFSFLTVLPMWAISSLAFLPILGWSCLKKESLTALLWFIGFGSVICVLARPDNNYWVVVLLPAYLMGLAFLPRFFIELFRCLGSDQQSFRVKNL